MARCSCCYRLSRWGRQVGPPGWCSVPITTLRTRTGLLLEREDLPQGVGSEDGHGIGRLLQHGHPRGCAVSSPRSSTQLLPSQWEPSPLKLHCAPK